MYIGYLKASKGKKIKNAAISMKINGLEKRHLWEGDAGRWEFYVITMYTFLLTICNL